MKASYRPHEGARLCHLPRQETDLEFFEVYKSFTQTSAASTPITGTARIKTQGYRAVDELVTLPVTKPSAKS